MILNFKGIHVSETDCKFCGVVCLQVYLRIPPREKYINGIFARQLYHFQSICLLSWRIFHSTKRMTCSKRRYSCLYLCLLDGAWQQEKIFFSLSRYTGSKNRHSFLYLCLLDGAWQQEKIFLSNTRTGLAAREDILVFISVY